MEIPIICLHFKFPWIVASMMGSNEGVEVEISNRNHLCEEDSQGCLSQEVEERIQNAEARISQLELEIEHRKKDYAVLEAAFKELESQKSLVDQELKDLRESIDPSNYGARLPMVSGHDDFLQVNNEGEEESNDFLLRAEIKALECEKLKAEEDARLWKHRYSDLELQFLQSCGIGLLAKGLSTEDTKGKTPHASSSFHQLPEDEKAKESVVENICITPSQDIQVTSEAAKKCNSLISARCSARIRKQLTFGEERPGRKIAPLTPAAKPTSISVINVSDSDDNCDGDDEQMVSPGLSTSKRKRVVNIIRSDSESEDDHLPINYLKQQHLQGPRPSTRRVMSLRQREKMRGLENSSPPTRTRPRYGQGITTICGIEDDESEEVETDSEGESLNDFIVNDSEGGSSHSEESVGEEGIDQLEESDADDANGQSADVSDSDMHEILAVISRRKGRESKWKFEADMLADLGKDPELCMRAVCALCRLQTSDEQANKVTQHYNKRGFSQPDAYRGTTLGMFLTDGDLAGDVKKTVRELEQYDPKGLEVCRYLATKYSKQLFKIYQNKEDPLFSPS